MKRPGVIVLLVLSLGLSVFLMGRLLVDSEELYLETSQAVAQHDDLGTDTFRLGGKVVPGSIEVDGDTLYFLVTDLKQEIRVRTTETAPELFSDKIGVFLDGSFDGDEFHATTFLLRHEETYEAPAESP